MGYVAAAWLVAGILVGGYGWSIWRRRRTLAAEAADAAADAAVRTEGGSDSGAARASDDK